MWCITLPQEMGAVQRDALESLFRQYGADQDINHPILIPPPLTRQYGQTFGNGVPQALESSSQENFGSLMRDMIQNNTMDLTCDEVLSDDSDTEKKQ